MWASLHANICSAHSTQEIIAERLSARHVIAEYCVEIVCLYICMYVYIYVYIYMSRLGMPYGEAHTVVLYARGAIARPRDCTFFHNYSTFFHNSTTCKMDDSPSISLSMHRPHQRYCDWCCSKNQGFGAGEEAQTAWTWRETPLLLGKNIIPRCIYSPLQI